MTKPRGVFKYFYDKKCKNAPRYLGVGILASLVPDTGTIRCA